MSLLFAAIIAFFRSSVIRFFSMAHHFLFVLSPLSFPKKVWYNKFSEHMGQYYFSGPGRCPTILLCASLSLESFLCPWHTGAYYNRERRNLFGQPRTHRYAWFWQKHCGGSAGQGPGVELCRCRSGHPAAGGRPSSRDPGYSGGRGFSGRGGGSCSLRTRSLPQGEARYAGKKARCI